MTDFIIVGAGFSGLQVALKLKEKKKNFLLIEPRKFVGGRVLTKTFDDTLIELGGQWVGQLHKNLLHLINKYQIQTYDTHFNRNENYLYIKEGIKSSHLPNKMDKWIDEMQMLAEQLDVKAIWNHAKAKIWDKTTITQYLEQRFSNQSDINFARRLLENFLSSSADETSFLQALFFIASSKSFKFLLSFKNGAQEKRVFGGMNSLAKFMSKDLGKKHLKLNEFVTEIKKNATHYTVKTNKNIYKTRKIIITCSPKKINDIKFIPALPKKYTDWFNSYSPGKAFKFHFIYKKDDWTKSNQVDYFFKEDGLITEVTNNSTPNSQYNIYTGFIYGKDKDRLYEVANTKQKRAKILINEIAEIFGNNAKKYLAFVEYDWLLQPHQFGCFVSRPGVGMWTKIGKEVWKKPIDNNIYFIGTETSSDFHGYIEGALISAINVAKSF